MRSATKYRRLFMALLLTGGVLLAGCAHQTLDGSVPQANADDALMPFH